jgi:hypothetical protein
VSYAVLTPYGNRNLPPIILYWDKTVPGKRISSYTAFSPYVLMIRLSSLTTREMILFSTLLALDRYVLSPENSSVQPSMMESLNQLGIG